jgi:hypothetical protein
MKRGRIGKWLVWGARAATAALVAACGGSAAPAGQAPASQGGGAAPAAQATAAPDLFIHADTVLGSKNLSKDELPARSCVLNSRYAHNEEIVWRIRVLDPRTGKPMDDKALQSVVVQLADGTALNARYGPHPHDNPTDHFWAVSWDVPPTYPTGTLDYKITATAADGRQGTFVPFDVAPSKVTITSAVHPVAAGK